MSGSYIERLREIGSEIASDATLSASQRELACECIEGALNALEGAQDAPVVSPEERPVLRRPRLGVGEPDDAGVVFGVRPRRRPRPPSP